MRAVTELVEESADLFELSEKAPDEAAQERFGDILNDHLAHCEARIDKDFFDHPESFGLLEDFEPGFQHWLENLGLDTQQSTAITQRLPSRFALALHEEWLKEPERYEVIRKDVESPFTQAVGRRRQWLQYTAWLREQVNRRMFAEAFGLQQIYVPLRAYFEERDEENTDALDDKIDIPEQRGQGKKRRVVVNLHQSLADWAKRFDDQDTVKVISGGPGSGKSSFAKMFAAEVAETQGIPVLYVPLHLLDPEADLIQAVANFVAHDRYLRDSPLDARDGERDLLVIFDGLDELSMQGKAASEAAQQFVEEVLRRADAFVGQSLRRRFLITGRDLAIQANVSRLRRPQQILHVLPYHIDENAREGYRDPNGLLASDQRDSWWQHYSKITGKNFQTMPVELRIDNLTEITRQPLLNYLVALSYERKQLDFSSETTLNEVYADLLKAVYERQWEGGRKHTGTGELEEKDFNRILEEIALAVWHGDGRVATVETIHQRCKASNLDRYLEQFQEGAKKGVTRLLTAFYFRQAGDIRGEKTFEFTHKSFGEYLTARRLVRMLDRNQTQLYRHAVDPDDGWDERDALKHWAEICGPTAIDEYTNAFIQNEIALQPAKSWLRWQRTLCQLIQSAVTYSMPMERLHMQHFQNMLHQSRNAEEALLVFHRACALRTKEVGQINWPSKAVFGAWLKRLQGQRTGPKNTIAMQSFAFFPLTGCALYISDLYDANLVGANLFRANLGGAHLRSANLEGASLEPSS